MSGYGEQELLAMRISDLECCETATEIAVRIQKIMTQSQDRFESRHRRRDGGIFDVEISVLYRSTEGGRIVVFLRDITERKRVEAALRESKARMQLLIQASQIGLWDWNLLTNDVYYSPEWKQQLGYAEHEVTNRLEEWEKLVHSADRAPALATVKDYLEGRRLIYEVEFRMRHKDGSWRWIFTRGDSIRNEAGQPVRLMGCHIDITEHKRAEETMRQSEEQMRALAARLQSIREEERTQIAREIHDVLAQELTRLKIDIVWASRRLGAAVDEPTRMALAEKLQGMTEQTNTAITTVQKIATELRPVVLDSLGLFAAVEWQAADFEKRTGLACRATVPTAELALGHEQATAFFRILQESLTNVIRHAQATRVDVKLAVADGTLTLTVSDDGCGIAPEKLTDLHSIGLVGMRERALAINGRVDIHSAPDAGTTVKVRMPLIRSPESLKP
jgi:two-component system sensor histidine kinase UhpB